MKLRLREPQAEFSPCRIQIPPIRTIKTPMRLLITHITALNVDSSRTSRQKVCVHLLREHIKKALNSGLLSMLMRLGYISVGLWPIRT